MKGIEVSAQVRAAISREQRGDAMGTGTVSPADRARHHLQLAITRVEGSSIVDPGAALAHAGIAGSLVALAQLEQSTQLAARAGQIDARELAALRGGDRAALEAIKGLLDMVPLLRHDRLRDQIEAVLVRAGIEI